MSQTYSNKSPEQAARLIQATEEAIAKLKAIEVELPTYKVLQVNENYNNRTVFTGSIHLDVVKNIKSMERGLEVFKAQQACEHANTTGLQYEGSDSHKDYYENKCKDCGFIVETSSD